MIGSAIKKGIGGVGGAIIGGAGLIASGLISSAGAGKYVAGAAAIGASAKSGANWLGNKSFGRTNTISEKNLSANSKPSEVEEGQVTILDKILQETNNLVNIVQSTEIPESTKRELQLDKNIRHKNLIAAFESLHGPLKIKGKGKDEKDLTWWEKIKKWWSKLSILFKGPIIAGLILAAKKFFKMIGKFALRMLLVFVSPAMLGVIAAVLIMTNWKKIKKSIRNSIRTMKVWANKVMNFLGLGDMFDLSEDESTATGTPYEPIEGPGTPYVPVETATNTPYVPIEGPGELDRSDTEYVPPGGMDEDGNLYIDNERPPEEYVPPEGKRWQYDADKEGTASDPIKDKFEAEDPLDGVEIQTFGLDEDKEAMEEEIRESLKKYGEGDVEVEPTFKLPKASDVEVEPTAPGESDIYTAPPKTAQEKLRRSLSEFDTDGSLEQEIYAKTKRENEAYDLINDFKNNEVKGSRHIAKLKLKEYLAAGYGLDHSYLGDINKTGGYDTAINKGLDKTYGVGTEARQSAFDAGIGGVKQYDGQSTPTTAPTKADTPTKSDTPTKEKNLPTGMFAAFNEPAKSTGSMIVEKQKQPNDYVETGQKILPKVINLGSSSNNSVTNRTTAKSTKTFNINASVVNKDSVAVHSSK